MSQYLVFVTDHPVLFLALGAILGLIAWTEFRGFFRNFKDISPADAVQMMNHDNALVLDVREDAEMGSGRIGGAKHIPMSVLKQRVSELESSRDRPVICYCRSGARSVQACGILFKHDFKKVFNLAGGILAWENAELPKAKK